MATVYVANINFKVNIEQLQKEFETYGKVKSCKIITRKGYSKGYGFVEFENAEDMEKAIKADGKEFEGRKLQITKAKPQTEKKEAPKRNFHKRHYKRNYHKKTFVKREKEETIILVRKLAYAATEEQLKEAFKAYGVMNVTIAKFTSKKDGKEKSRGFAFVELSSKENMDKALKEMRGKEIEGRRFFVYQANKKIERPAEEKKEETQEHRNGPRRRFKRTFKPIRRTGYEKPFNRKPHVKKEKDEVTIFVKKLAYAATEEQVKEAFKAYDVMNVTIPKFTSKKDGKEKSRGFAFVELSSKENMDKALKEMRGKEIEGRRFFVYQANKKIERPAEEKKETK